MIALERVKENKIAPMLLSLVEESLYTPYRPGVCQMSCGKVQRFQ
jgi:hypothetical protein